MQQVKENHPLALVYNNSVQISDFYINESKGNFDPVFFGGIDQKYFDGSTYYSTLSTGIKIPTRIGVSFKAMGDWNSGKNLNPENRVPEAGLSYLGVEANIGRGMFTDAQRTQLKQAVVAFNQSKLDQQLLLNNLLYEAGQAYIHWQEQTFQFALAQEGYDLAQQRFNQLLETAIQGDRALIDTVEASAQLFLRKLDVQQRELNVMNAQLQVEYFMWEKGKLPLKLEPSTNPEPLTINKPEAVLGGISDNHPQLLTYSNKLTTLGLERRLKRENLKPQLTVNYNLLTPTNHVFSSNYSWSNYKWGGTLYMPVLLRKERNAYKAVGLKIENTQLEFELKRRELELKQQLIRNEWNTMVNQAQTAEAIAQRYRQLADAERALFINGESSLFLINAREISYLSSQSKYLEVLAKTNKLLLSEQFVLGVLGL
jgi:outer membrane protein TolC